MPASNTENQERYAQLRNRISNPDIKAGYDYTLNFFKSLRHFTCRPLITNSKKPKFAVEFYTNSETENPFSFIVNTKKGLLFYIKRPRIDITDDQRAYLESEPRFDFKAAPNIKKQATVRIDTSKDAEDFLSAIFHNNFRRTP